MMPASRLLQALPPLLSFYARPLPLRRFTPFASRQSCITPAEPLRFHEASFHDIFSHFRYFQLFHWASRASAYETATRRDCFIYFSPWEREKGAAAEKIFLPTLHSQSYFLLQEDTSQMWWYYIYIISELRALSDLCTFIYKYTLLSLIF